MFPGKDYIHQLQLIMQVSIPTANCVCAGAQADEMLLKLRFCGTFSLPCCLTSRAGRC